MIGLAFLPSGDLGYTLASFALCGFGLGLDVPDLTHAVLGGEGGIAPKATLTVGVRHLGLVLALAIGAPLLAGDLLAGADAAKLNAAAVIIDGEIPGTTKIPWLWTSATSSSARRRARSRTSRPRSRGRCGDRRRRSAGARRLGRDDRTGRHQELPTVVPVLRAARGAALVPILVFRRRWVA